MGGCDGREEGQVLRTEEARRDVARTRADEVVRLREPPRVEAHGGGREAEGFRRLTDLAAGPQAEVLEDATPLRVPRTGALRPDGGAVSIRSAARRAGPIRLGMA